MKNAILASTSTVYGSAYLEYLLPELTVFFKDVSELIFIPFAQPGGIDYNTYTEEVSKAVHSIGIKVKGLHEFENQDLALKQAQAIFVGGGNTFLLVTKLYELNLMEVLKSVIENGTPYLGTSAGTNICCVTMQNSNDMPIIYPPSFKTMGIIPFNINPHFIEADPLSKHKGETRETRIKEFHSFNDIPVLGLREGSWLEVKGDQIILKGGLSAKLFLKDKQPKELPNQTELHAII